VLFGGGAAVFALGALYKNKRHGATGKDLIVFRSELGAAPGLVWDGCCYSFMAIRTTLFQRGNRFQSM
jgi:hypothetical protein